MLPVRAGARGARRGARVGGEGERGRRGGPSGPPLRSSVTVVVVPVVRVAAVLHADGQVLAEAERQQRFSGDVDCLAVGGDLRAGPCRRTNRGADRGTFAAAGDRADDRAEQRTAADVFAGGLVRADRARAL